MKAKRVILVVFPFFFALFQASPAFPLSKVGPWIDAIDSSSATISFTYNASSASVDYGYDTGYGLGTVNGTPASIDNPFGGFTTPFGNKFEVKLQALQPSTHYDFRIRVGSDTFATGNFTTAPASGQPFTFIAFGDTREGANADHQRVRNCILADEAAYGPYAFLANTGDLQAANSPADWQNFFEIEAVNSSSPAGKGAAFLNTIPFFPTRGNHDNGNVWYKDFFAPPTFNSGDENFYSFDYGTAHFIFLDTNAVTGSNPQYQFLVADLQAQKAAGYPGPIFVALHAAGVSTGNHGNSGPVQSTFFPQFQEYGVDAVFQGHDHHYERFVPINGVTYFVTGGGGADLYNVGVSGKTAFSQKTFNYMILEVNGNDVSITSRNDACSTIDSVSVDASSNNGVYHSTDPFPPDAGTGGGCAVGSGPSTASGKLGHLFLLACPALAVGAFRSRRS